MKKNVDAIIFIPFCEKEYDMLFDTIDSVKFYVKEKYHIIAIDDFSPSRLNERLKYEVQDITVLRNPKQHGGRSGLYVTQSIACKYAIQHFNFKVFIKMDTDALMVGPSLVTKAIRKFDAEPQLGILGSYRHRADGKMRNWFRWRLVFLYESNKYRKLFGKPTLWQEAIMEAKKNNYKLGENVLGGCYIISERCLLDMYKKGYLDYEYQNILNHSIIGDEIIYSLFCKAVGYNIKDFGKPNDPMVIALDIVPIPKEKIISTGKSVIHSVKKGFNGETQDELRKFFGLFRENGFRVMR